MRIIADLHTHTHVSQHAYSSLYEMIQGAKRKGLEAIAITDHGPDVPDGAMLCHFSCMKGLPANIDGIRFYSGAEINITDYNGGLDINNHVLQNLDFTIASYHIETILPSTREEHSRGWHEVMKNPFVDCAGHAGNPVFDCDLEMLVKSCAEFGKLIEINNASFRVRKGSEDNCREIARLCKKHDVSIVVTSDSHFYSTVGQFDDALKLLEEVNFPEELVVNSSRERLENYFAGRSRPLFPREVPDA